MASSDAGKGVSNINNEEKVVSTTSDLVTAIPTSVTSIIVSENPAPATITTNPPLKIESTATATATKISQPVPSAEVSTPPHPNPVPPRATSSPSAASEASVKNRSSREEKSRKKDDKSVDHVLRTLNSFNTTAEKLAAMCKKYADIFDEHRKLQLSNKQTEKRCSMMQREKEQLQAEHSKAILTRSRLENLCRELQRQNKAIKDESLLKIREEEEKRKEVSTKFQTTMNEITTLMQQNNDKNLKLRDDNIDMTAKLKNICEQYELRQQQVERISKQMQLEQQLADAKLSKLKMEITAEREMFQREKQQLLLELQQYQQRCTEFQATEINLRNQISMYNDKYDEFQKALARSNDVFGGFKGEMEKMSKKICKLEKETSAWKQRWECSHKALLELAADKQKSEQELAVVSRQLTTLQNLCRTLQTERSNLIAKLKSFQTGDHESQEKSAVIAAEKCNQQCEQALNHAEHPTTLIVTDPCPDHCCAQDILASFQESVAAKDAPTAIVSTTDRVVTVCEETVPVPVSPLPDVVGTLNNLSLDKKPDVNSDLCQRLENTCFEPGQENLSDQKENVQQNIVNVPTVQDSSVDPTKLDETLNQPSVIVENLTSQVVAVPILNGSSDILTNGTSPADSVPQADVKIPQTQLPKSPTTSAPKSSPTKVGDSGKKIKDSTKKKK